MLASCNVLRHLIHLIEYKLLIKYMYVLLTYPLVPLVPWLLGFHQVLGVLCVPWHLGILVLHQLLGRHQVHRILWLPVVPLVLDVRQVQLVWS